MPSFKKLSVLALAVFALSVVGVANASAAQFTASATGELSGKALNTQVFKSSTGLTVECTTATSSGTIKSTASEEQEVAVKYGNCTTTIFGTKYTTHVSEAKYLFTASGEVHILNTIKIEPTVAGCTLSVGPQTRKTVTYKTSGSNIVEESNVTGITYTGSGGLCGTSGTSTYTGNNELSRVGGGTLAFD